MRYRSANSVPGTNRLSPRVDDELDKRDPVELGIPEEEAEARGVAGLEAATVRVAKTSTSTGFPQLGQKRLWSAISPLQDGHDGMNFS